MGFLRIRTTVDERPGRLASLAAALAEHGGNILGLSVQPDTDGTVDEFVAEIPASPDAVRTSLEAAGGRRVHVVTATPQELTDEPTRVLLLAARLRAMPWRLPEILNELLRADDARWVYGTARSGSARVLPDPTLLTVPVAPRRAIRLRRAGLPFTLTEAARAAALVRLAQPSPDTPTPETEIVLAGGGAVQVRPLTALYREAVRDLHQRCSAESRRERYFAATAPAMPARMFDRLCDRDHGHSLVAGHDGQVVALASLMFTPDPGIAEVAFLVEDRWQGRGLGAALAQALIERARDLGFSEVRATMLAANTRMRRLAVSLGATVHLGTGEPATLEARIAIGTVAPSPAPRRVTRRVR